MATRNPLPIPPTPLDCQVVQMAPPRPPIALFQQFIFAALAGHPREYCTAPNDSLPFSPPSACLHRRPDSLVNARYKPRSHSHCPPQRGVCVCAHVFPSSGLFLSLPESARIYCRTPDPEPEAFGFFVTSKQSFSLGTFCFFVCLAVLRIDVGNKFQRCSRLLHFPLFFPSPGPGPRVLRRPRVYPDREGAITGCWDVYVHPSVDFVTVRALFFSASILC